MPNDLARAFMWCCIAAERGYVDAQYQIAAQLEVGNGCIADPKKALMWCGEAAEGSQARAINAVKRLGKWWGIW